MALLRFNFYSLLAQIYDGNTNEYKDILYSLMGKSVLNIMIKWFQKLELLIINVCYHKTNLKPIELIQKKAIRIINNVGYTHPTHKLFHKLGILKFKNIVESMLGWVSIIMAEKGNFLPQKCFLPKNHLKCAKLTNFMVLSKN